MQCRTEAVHVDVSILPELLRKLCSQSRVHTRRKVSQSIPQSQLERQRQRERHHDDMTETQNRRVQ